jgi:hypothetical protein
MTDPIPMPQAAETDKRICEKCRLTYFPEQFAHGIGGYACVCTRCMRAMGYGA